MPTPREDLLARVKVAVRRTDTTAYDTELSDLISACLKDLSIVGIDSSDLTDALIIRAVCTFCRFNFGSIESDEYEHLKASYDEQKAQLQMASAYTNYDLYGITSFEDELEVSTDV